MKFFSQLSHLCSRGFSESSAEKSLGPSSVDLQDVPTMKKQGSSSSAPAKEVIKVAYCSICLRSKPISKFFSINGCDHSFCRKCLSSYIASKVAIKEAVIRCPYPQCSDGRLEPLACKELIKQKFFDRWCDVLCEASVAVKFYCPFLDCSAVLEDERAGNKVEEMASVCPHCHRLFCAHCRVPWHDGLSCREFKKDKRFMEKSLDRMLVNLATQKKWKRCPRCKFYVEKRSGCKKIKCRLK